jgi:hypothetical protein
MFCIENCVKIKVMKKSYSNFTTYEDVKSLGLNVKRKRLFTQITPVQPSEFLQKTLKLNQETPMESEKAKSELLITPILNEVRTQAEKRFTFFSGYQFNVDSSRGLKGFCDYLISGKEDAIFIESPLIAVVEAKHNQDLPDAAPQCIAEMYAAQIFNEKNNEPQKNIYGVITTGYDWLFLKLDDTTVFFDTGERYFLNNLPELLGVWKTLLANF